MKINQIVMHHNPHLDEIAALWLLRNYGSKFTGLASARIVTWGKKELKETTPEVAAMSGILLVGIGGGMFDDHKPDGQRVGCATSLVAKYLGIDEDPLLARFIRDVQMADKDADGPLQTLAEQVKGLNRYWAGSIDLEMLYRQVEPMIQIEISRQHEYLEAKEILRNRMTTVISGVKLVVGDNVDNRQFQLVARLSGASVTIQRNSEGLTQIFGFGGLDMRMLAMKVRKAEISHRKIRIGHFIRDERFMSAGSIPEVPQWHLDRNNLLNGSESYPDTEPSAISIRDLYTIVRKHIEETVPQKKGVSAVV